MGGEGRDPELSANRVGSNCGYQLTPSETEWRYAIDQGLQRKLYLSGGTAAGPEAIRLMRGSSVVIEHRTVLLTGNSGDVCRNHPPRDARWWISGVIDEEVADAIRRNDTTLYRLEALVGGSWQTIQLHDSGCAQHSFS